MIKNVIFDFGQVLVHFNNRAMVEKYIEDKNEQDVALLEEVVFDRLYWDKLDLGTITDEEVIRCVCERIPQRLHAVAKNIYQNWTYNIPEIEGMRALIEQIKKDFGVKTFLLSNISTSVSKRRHEFPIFQLFDACLFSADYHIVKPSAEIFYKLAELGNFQLNESIFIDDSQKNIDGAKAVGLQGYLFDGDVEKLKAYLYTLLNDK